MKQFEHQISSLIVKYIKEEITGKEIVDLENWIKESPSNKELFESLLQEKNFEQRIPHSSAIDLDSAYSKVKQKINARQKHTIKPRVVNWKKISAYAASILIPLAIGVFLLLKSDLQEMEVAVVEAGSQKAQLYFSTGEKMELDQTTIDTLYKDNTVLVANKGVVSYKNEKRVKAEINRIMVPRGGEFQMVLADGTKVWLNSESELTYPTVFTEKTRLVTVKGEVYFEVAKNKEKPFIVETSGQLVKVLGTQFNVRNYKEENKVVTTLVEGSIELISKDEQFTRFSLVPGEQSILDFNSGQIIKRSVKAEEYASWKDGIYIFKSRPLGEVMYELARWYDLKVDFKGETIKESIVTGRFKRANSFNSFVELLEKIEVAHFEIDDKNIIVSE